MRYPTKGRLLLLGLFGVACSGDGGTEPPAPEAYNVIAATYVGAMTGITQGVALDATFTLTITQNGGVLSGSHGTVGTLDDGVQSVDIQGSGTISGTIERGDNPSVNITLVFGSCPGSPMQFSGAYDTANRRLTLLGPVHIFNASCVVVLTYQMTVILNR